MDIFVCPVKGSGACDIGAASHSLAIRSHRIHCGQRVSGNAWVDTGPQRRLDGARDWAGGRDSVPGWRNRAGGASECLDERLQIRGCNGVAEEAPELIGIVHPTDDFAQSLGHG